MRISIMKKSGYFLKKKINICSKHGLSDVDMYYLENNLEYAYGGLEARNLMTQGRLMWCYEDDQLFSVFDHKFLQKVGRKWVDAEDINIDSLYFEVGYPQ